MPNIIIHDEYDMELQNKCIEIIFLKHPSVLNIAKTTRSSTASIEIWWVKLKISCFDWWQKIILSIGRNAYILFKHRRNSSALIQIQIASLKSSNFHLRFLKVGSWSFLFYFVFYASCSSTSGRYGKFTLRGWNV